MKAHDTFLRCAEAQQIDASVPDSISIHNGVFLMDSFTEDDFDLEFTEHADRHLAVLRDDLGSESGMRIITVAFTCF